VRGGQSAPAGREYHPGLGDRENIDPIQVCFGGFFRSFFLRFLGFFLRFFVVFFEGGNIFFEIVEMNAFFWFLGGLFGFFFFSSQKLLIFAHILLVFARFCSFLVIFGCFVAHFPCFFNILIIFSDAAYAVLTTATQPLPPSGGGSGSGKAYFVVFIDETGRIARLGREKL
jgi:hypothetical protein